MPNETPELEQQLIPDEVPQAIGRNALVQSLIASRAASIQIVDDASLTHARVFLVDLKTTWNNIEAERVGIKKPLDEAVGRVQAFFRRLLTPLETAEAIVKPKIANYLAAQERVRQEEERRQRAEADRIRAEQEAAARRLEEQAAAALAKAEQEARDAQAEADRQERRRAAAVKSGRHDIAADAAARAAEFQTAAGNVLARGEQESEAALDQAQATQHAASSISTPSVERAARPTGTTLRKIYSAELTDMKALCKAIADGRAPITLVKFDQGAANKMAAVMKEGFAGSYPGVRLIIGNDVTQRTTG